MEEKPSIQTLSSPSSCIEPINAIPLNWYPASALASRDSAPFSSSSTHQSGLETGTWTKAHASSLSVASVNQSPEQGRDSEVTGFSTTEILLFGVRIKVSNSDSSLSVSTVDDDHQFVQNQNQPRVKKHDGSSIPDSRNRVRLFGTWISKEETASENNKLGSSIPDSRNRVRLFGTWISKEETASENKKLGLQETSKLIKKRVYTRRLFKKRAVEEQNGGERGSYKENIGELLAEKILTKSDIDQSSRLLLSRETVEKRLLPILNANYPQGAEHCRSLNGLRMEIFDADTDDGNGHSYSLVLKQWVTRSFVFTGNWKKDFVKRRSLKEDDQVGLFWDQNQHRFNFSVKQIGSQRFNNF